ncbi:hypothetical protein GCM10023261_05390 [Bartonella jaculi]|uniref:Uncharacterized protein n=1 Tax=Bartonella jaculi TaxID=686226 RepID=A0ABP9N451_9HYPH
MEGVNISLMSHYNARVVAALSAGKYKNIIMALSYDSIALCTIISVKG